MDVSLIAIHIQRSDALIASKALSAALHELRELLGVYDLPQTERIVRAQKALNYFNNIIDTPTD